MAGSPVIACFAGVSLDTDVESMVVVAPVTAVPGTTLSLLAVFDAGTVGRAGGGTPILVLVDGWFSTGAGDFVFCRKDATPPIAPPAAALFFAASGAFILALLDTVEPNRALSKPSSFGVLREPVENSVHPLTEALSVVVGGGGGLVTTFVAPVVVLCSFSLEAVMVSVVVVVGGGGAGVVVEVDAVDVPPSPAVAPPCSVAGGLRFPANILIPPPIVMIVLADVFRS